MVLKWKQPSGHSLDEWLNTLWNVHARERCSALRGNPVPKHAATAAWVSNMYVAFLKWQNYSDREQDSDWQELCTVERQDVAVAMGRAQDPWNPPQYLETMVPYANKCDEIALNTQQCSHESIWRLWSWNQVKRFNQQSTSGGRHTLS